TAWHRFLACVIASLYSFIFFEGLGYNAFVVGLMLAVFIPTTVWLKITQGITTSSVIIINLYGAQHISYAVFCLKKINYEAKRTFNAVFGGCGVDAALPISIDTQAYLNSMPAGR